MGIMSDAAPQPITYDWSALTTAMTDLKATKAKADNVDTRLQTIENGGVPAADLTSITDRITAVENAIKALQTAAGTYTSQQ